MIIGHQKQWQLLKKTAEMGKIPHALLFSGQSQLGKKTMAIEFARFLMGGEKKQIEGDSFSVRSEPDFILIEAESDKGEIQISQVRELIWKLSLRPYSAPYKVAVIDKACRMNREAQNCFLKTLEEPKGKSILILISEYPETLAPTILSRVQKVRFFPVKKEEIENYLEGEGISKERVKRLADLAGGRPGRAIDFLRDEQKIENREKIISDIAQIAGSDFSFRFNYAKNLSEQNLAEVLDVWLDYFRNLFLRGLSGRPESGYSLAKLKKIINLIQSTDYLISTTNVNPKLALEILLMEL